MTVNTANALFMVSLAIFSAVAAAALAVVFEQWWNRRQTRQDADEVVPEAVHPIVEATKAFQSLSKTLSTRPRPRNNLNKENDRG